VKPVASPWCNASGASAGGDITLAPVTAHPGVSASQVSDGGTILLLAANNLAHTVPAPSLH
jgi:hypothetical protein